MRTSPVPGVKPSYMHVRLTFIVAEEDVALKRSVREQVRALPFADQAALFAEHARAQLGIADDHIADALEDIPGERPAAVSVWKRIVADKTQESDAERIGRLFPQLAIISVSLAEAFRFAFTFWNNRVFAVDVDGSGGTTPALFNPLQNLTPEQIAFIDQTSGMPFLGVNLKNYAGFLAATAD